MKKTKLNIEPIILLALSAIYFITLLKITLLRDSYNRAQSVNLIPFYTIIEYSQSIINGNKIVGITNILGNLIIFFPLGYITAFFLPKMRKLTRILILSFAFSLVIELLQYVFMCGQADIDDVILNILGGIIGYLIYNMSYRFIKHKKHAVIICGLLITFTCIGFIDVSNIHLFNLSAPNNHLTRNIPSTSNILPTPSTHPTPNTISIPNTISTPNILSTPNSLSIYNNLSAPSETLDNNYSNETLNDNEIVIINTDSDLDLTDDINSNINKAAWNLILVNKWHHIPNDYEMELKELSNGQSVDKRIYLALQEMFDAARSDGVYPIVIVGYRTIEQQQYLLDKRVAAYKAEGYSANEAKAIAEAWVAIPGTSEHQIGIAVDIDADDIHSTEDEVYEWFSQNAYKYGFILRYPQDKTELTGIKYEPWHYRYVGIEAATDIKSQGICLEEYLTASLLTKNILRNQRIFNQLLE